MRLYTKLIRFSSVCNIVFSITRSLIGQRPISTANYFFYFTVSPLFLHCSQTLQQILIYITYIVVFFHGGIPAVQFYYRYKTLKDVNVTKTQIEVAYFAMFAFWVVHSLTFYFLFEENPEIYIDDIFGGIKGCTQELPTFTVIYKDAIANQVHNILGHVGLSLISFIMIYYALKTWRVYNQHARQMTKKKLKMNRSVNLLFLLQTGIAHFLSRGLTDKKWRFLATKLDLISMLQPTFNLPCSVDSLDWFYAVSNDIIGAIAIFLSSVVVYLSRQTHEMKVYAKLIILTSCFTILLSLTRIFIAQRPISTSDYNYYFTTSFVLYHASAGWQHVGIVINHLVVYIHVGIPVIQIYYRYKVLKASDVTGRQLFFVFFVVVLYSFINAITFLSIFHKNPVIFTEKVFGGAEGCNQKTIPTFTVLDKVCRSAQKRYFLFKRTLASQIHNVFGHTGLSISYMLVVYYTYRAWRVFKDNAGKITRKKEHINRVVTIVFFLQVIPPFLFTVLPIIIFASHILPSSLMGYISVVLGVGPSLTPLFDSLTILFIIPSYRRRFLKVMRLSSPTLVSTSWSKNSVGAVQPVRSL
uniref:Serpentine receptor class gamma n=1 Tax=Bursaphelenchus xylophilus TaxID=6326 RepID=A0A1I7RPA5_BURXY